jgi:putative DNA primase/helicase
MSDDSSPFAPPPRPTALELRPEQIPAQLKAFAQFLLWDWELRRDNKGKLRWTKPPHKVVGTGYAKSTDSAGWGSFDDAIATLQSRAIAGVGFALSPDDPFSFGDLDDCRDPETGEISEWAKPVLATFAASYQEVSPSGTGIKILIQGELPGTQHRWKLGPEPLAYIEWFDRAKYTTLTGHRLENAGADIVDCQAELDALFRSCFPPAAPPNPRSNAAPPVTGDDDDAVLARIRKSRQGALFTSLFDYGDASGYGDDKSAADMALIDILAFWFGPDRARIDRMLRRSALMRDKWEERANYRDMTIDKALAGRTEFYTPRESRRLTLVPSVEGTVAGTADDPATILAHMAWPVLGEAALAGLAGDIVLALAPHTEADDVATLVTFLVLFGCACNRSPHVMVGEGSTRRQSLRGVGRSNREGPQGNVAGCAETPGRNGG